MVDYYEDSWVRRLKLMFNVDMILNYQNKYKVITKTNLNIYIFFQYDLYNTFHLGFLKVWLKNSIKVQYFLQYDNDRKVHIYDQ